MQTDIVDPMLSGATFSSSTTGTQVQTSTIQLTVTDCSGATSTDTATVTWECTFTL